MKRNIAIIGAGIFGLTAALELSETGTIDVYERHDDILSEATSNNQLRHHMGYHYPRSQHTVDEIKQSAHLFEKEFGTCITHDFPAYYAIAKEHSKTDAQQFLAFCQHNHLPYQIINPPDWLVNKEKISLLVKTPEGVYDPQALKDLLKEKLREKSASVHLYLGHEVTHGSRTNGKKTLSIRHGDTTVERTYDIIINATYAHFNTFNAWFGLETPLLQYDLMEILEIDLPEQPERRFGLLILDGEFATILPKGNSATFTLGHVKHTMLHRTTAKHLADTQKSKNAPTNRELIIQASQEYMPFLHRATVVKSLYSTRAIKPFHGHDDARPTEITDHGDGLYSIFAGKVITAVKTAKDLHEMIRQ